jgi:hypothetical protein
VYSENALEFLTGQAAPKQVTTIDNPGDSPERSFRFSPFSLHIPQKTSITR